MRKVLFGIVWFLVFWLGSLIVAGAIVGGLAGHQASVAHPASTVSQGYDQGYAAGHAAGRALSKKYGSLFWIGSLIFAVGGSALGVLPGTQRRST